MMQEVRCAVSGTIPKIPKNFQVYFGPPGTGKTTTLSKLVQHYAEDDGPESLLLTSFTRAAAHELAGRELPVSAHGIGTLHSHCYHGLDRPRIAESHVKDWNEAFPYYPMTATARTVHDTATTTRGALPDEHGPRHEELAGDTLLSAYNLVRAAMQPATACAAPVRHFIRLWEDWKGQHGYLDFTDVLTRGLAVLRVAPGNPATIIVDEAQDLTPLQWAIIAQWSQHAQRTIAGGDDDQALYSWCGADPDLLLQADASAKRVLPHSYRLPQTIYLHAQQYLEAITRREPKRWTSNGTEGWCEPADYQWRNPESLAPLVAQTLEEPWGSCMILAPCSYMLTDLVTMLRAEGIPFANPWRRRRGDWNPLYYAGKGIASVTRLLDFLRPPERLWTWRELASWVGILRKRGNLLPEATVLLTLHEDEDRVCPLEDVRRLFTPDALSGALSGSLVWFEDRIRKQYAHGMAFPLKAYRRYGRVGLAEDPRIYVGTCHSVKGGEADRVVLFTELSRSFQQARAQGGDTADAVERMLYVGATRAREELYVIG